MSEKREDGGPAFPCGVFNQDTEQYDDALGMTLRDYFAAKALSAIYASAMRDAAGGSGLFEHQDWPIGLAHDAYRMADAMLAARKT